MSIAKELEVVDFSKKKQNTKKNKSIMGRNLINFTYNNKEYIIDRDKSVIKKNKEKCVIIDSSFETNKLSEIEYNFHMLSSHFTNKSYSEREFLSKEVIDAVGKDKIPRYLSCSSNIDIIFNILKRANSGNRDLDFITIFSKAIMSIVQNTKHITCESYLMFDIMDVHNERYAPRYYDEDNKYYFSEPSHHMGYEEREQLRSISPFLLTLYFKLFSNGIKDVQFYDVNSIQPNGYSISNMSEYEAVEYNGETVEFGSIMNEIINYDSNSDLSERIEETISNCIPSVFVDSLSDKIYTELTGKYIDRNKELEDMIKEANNKLNKANSKIEMLNGNNKSKVEEIKTLKSDCEILNSKLDTIDVFYNEKMEVSSKINIDNIVKLKNENSATVLENLELNNKKNKLVKTIDLQVKEIETLYSVRAKNNEITTKYNYTLSNLNSITNKYENYNAYAIEIGKLNCIFARYTSEIFNLLDAKFFDQELTKKVYEENIRVKMIEVCEAVHIVSSYTKEDIAHNKYVKDNIVKTTVDLTEDLENLKSMKEVLSTLPDKKKKSTKVMDMKALLSKMTNFAEERNKLD